MGPSQSDVDELRLHILLSLHEHWVFYLIEGVILIALGAAAIILSAHRYPRRHHHTGWLFLISGIVGLFTTCEGSRVFGGLLSQQFWP